MKGQRGEKHDGIQTVPSTFVVAMIFTGACISTKIEEDCACACFGARAGSSHSWVVHEMQSPAECSGRCT